MTTKPTVAAVLGALVLLPFLATPGPLAAQQKSVKAPELTGSVDFDVSSKSGIVESLVFNVGDGGSGSYKAVIVGDPTLPTHAIYRPRDLRPFGGARLLPVVAWANGGCRNTSGEFRNFLIEVASHGFLVLAIGPAAHAIALGSEAPVGGTKTSQLFDGLTWAAAENDRAESPYYRKIDPAKFAVMGQSCGGVQALDASGDPRVKTTVVWNSGLFARSNLPSDLVARMGMPVVSAESLASTTAPVAFFVGGPSDIAFGPAKAGFDALKGVVFMANREVGHYPATYRQPRGGAFATVAVAWLEWQLNGNKTAAASFVGKTCRLCTDRAWTVEKKGVD